MTNHEPTEKETFLKRIGKKKKAFKIKSWKDEYEKRRLLKEKKK